MLHQASVICSQPGGCSGHMTLTHLRSPAKNLGHEGRPGLWQVNAHDDVTVVGYAGIRMLSNLDNMRLNARRLVLPETVQKEDVVKLV